MKSPKFILVAIALCFSIASFSQVDTTKKDTTTQKTDTTKKKKPALSNNETSNAQDQQATISESTESNNAAATTNSATTNAATTNTTNTNTVTDNAATNNSAATENTAASSTPKPNFGRYYIPVLGNYSATSSSTETKSITITGDETNPGKVWIDGLTGTKFYALLKSVPGTYKIPAQKQDDNSVAEGTVVYDADSKQINLCVGCGFNDQSPAVTDASATTEPTAEVAKVNKNQHAEKAAKKTPIISFTGTKSDQSTVSILQ